MQIRNSPEINTAMLNTISNQNFNSRRFFFSKSKYLGPSEIIFDDLSTTPGGLKVAKTSDDQDESATKNTKDNRNNNINQSKVFSKIKPNMDHYNSPDFFSADLNKEVLQNLACIKIKKSMERNNGLIDKDVNIMEMTNSSISRFKNLQKIFSDSMFIADFDIKKKCTNHDRNYGYVYYV